MPRSSTVSKRYASALFQLSCQHPGADDIGKSSDILAELKSFLNVLNADSEIRKFFLSPVIAKEDKKSVLGELRKFSPSVVKFLQVLVDGDRLELLDSIIAEFQRLMEESAGEESVELQIAHNLSNEALEEIKSFLESAWGRKLRLQVNKNPALLGGFLAKSNSRTFDASIRSQLENLKQQIAQ